MKRKCIALALCILVAAMASLSMEAQTLSGESAGVANKNYIANLSVLHKGDNLVNLTVGVINFDYVPPFTAVSYERMVWQINDNLCGGVGATCGLSGVEGCLGLGLYALANLHFTLVKNLDIYTGLDLGGIIPLDEYGITKMLKKTVKPVHIGANYFFSKNFAATIRVGGWGVISVGFAGKF